MKKIKIVEVKEVTYEGKKFNTYKALGKGGRKLDARFVKGCNNVPTAPCIIVVEDDCANVDISRQYPILWVKNVTAIEEFEHKNNIDEYFD